MDISPEYIKMCEKAVEIQKLAPRNEVKNWWSPDDLMVWLPRQDQLQEMCENKGEDFFIFAFRSGSHPLLDTYEKLWLAFVMKEKYGKVWNGEDWVKR